MRSYANTGSLVNTGDYLPIRCAEWASVGVKIEGTFSGALTFTGQVGDDFTGGTAVGVYDTGGNLHTSVTTTGTYVFPAAGYTSLDVIFSTATSGSPRITLVPSAAPYIVASSGGGGGGSGFSDLLLTDSNNILFVGKDTGAVTPNIAYFKISDSSSYTPVGTITVAGSAASGGATSAKQDTGNTSLASLDTKTPALVSGRQPVDGSGVVQPVSATTLPLPTGAATDAVLTGKAQTTRLTDGTNDITMITTSADGTSAASNRVPVQAHNKAYNGSTWDLIRVGITGVKSAFLGFLNVLPQGIYNSTPPTLTNGQGTDLQLDSSGNLKVAGSLAIATISQTAFKVLQTYTRPANTTTYTIGFAISGSTSAGAQLTYAAVGAANQYIVIEEVEIISSQKGSPLPQIAAYIFGTTLSGATCNDGAALEVDATSYRIGGCVVPCVETSNTAARSKTVASNLNRPLKLDASGNFYVVLQALNAYIPASGETFDVVIRGYLR